MIKYVGVVGTGMLGAAIARRLAQAGHKVFVYNRTSQKALDLTSCGCVYASNPKEVAQLSDLVITVVRDGSAVLDVSFGKDGIIHGCETAPVIADMSTISPMDSVKINKRFEEHNIVWLGTPVMGGPDAAADGRLVLIADGDKASFDGTRDVFDVLCNKIHYVGKSGTAHAVKLCMNMQIASLAVSLSEGITLARIMNVPPETFLDVLNSTYFGTGMSRNKAFKMINSQYNATFTLENLTKDLNIVCDTAKPSDVYLEMSQTILSMYTRALSEGMGDLDYTGILEFVRQNTKSDNS